MNNQFFYLILLLLIILCCKNDKLYHNINLDYKKELEENEFQLIICYRDFDLVFDKSIKIDNAFNNAFDNQAYDYVVIVNDNRLSYYIEDIIKIFKNIDLGEKYNDYDLDIFFRCDLITKKDIIYRFCLGEYYNDIVWINGNFYKTKDKEILYFIVDSFKPWKSYRSNIDFKKAIQNLRKQMEHTPANDSP